MNTTPSNTAGSSTPSAMSLVPSSRLGRVMARLVVALLVTVGLVLAVTPWQQSTPGEGRVIAYAPGERRQNLEAPIEGRVLRWYVREGASVKAGAPIVDLTDNDPEILTRIRNERDAIEARLRSATDRARSLEARIDSLDESRRNGIAAADARVLMAEQRVASAEQAVVLARTSLETARANTTRQQTLADNGLTSQRQLELVRLDEERSATELERAELGLVGAKSELAAVGSDRSKVATDASAAIEDARASRAQAEAEVANASAELARIEVRLARQSAQSVVAPRAGTIFRIEANGQEGEMVKAGDILAVLVPETVDRAVELWIPGNDVPLVDAGAKARMQFEGWPALQFSGWPSVAVGTFAGRVDFVDEHGNDQGEFRVIIVPEAGSAWPSPRYLRQGVKTQGWIQLGTVRLGYELWRQFNGFPASRPPELSSASSSAKGKP